MHLKRVIKISRLYYGRRVNVVIVRIEPRAIQFVVWQMLLVTKELIVRSD